MLYLIGGVLSVFEAPSFGVVNGALWGLVMIGLRLMVSSRSMVNWSMVNHSMMYWSSMVNWATMVDKSSRVGGRSSMVDGFSSMVDWFRARVVYRGGVIHRLCRTICWGRGITINGGIGMHRGSGHGGEDLKYNNNK